MSGSMGRWLSIAAIVIGGWACDDGDDTGGDAPCPEDTIRSGNTCVPDPTGGTDGGGVGGMGGGVGGMGGGAGGMDDGGLPDAGPGDLTLPLIVDDHYAPSGFMGDGETGGIVADNDCPMRAGEEGGLCHRFAYTAADRGFGGVFWQFPDGNWGDAPGLDVPDGATRLQFYAWGAAGGEEVRFVMGYGEADGFAVETEFVTLTDAPTLITLDLAGVPYTDIAGGLAWFVEADATFYMDDIRIVNDPADMVDPCTVSCATLQGLGECDGKTGYSACKTQCADRRAGDCGAQADAWLTCVSDGGWMCNAGNAAPTNGCAAERDALVACEGEAPAAPLPFYIEEHFTMSGYMGGGEVESAPCAADEGDGACLRITWTPGDAEWVGFFFQYPENNWGDLPGLAIADGATHIRFRAWGETGGERANFAAGIADVDSFNVESGYMALGTEPTDGVLAIPAGVDEVTGGFAWFLEANGADSVTFYLDDVQWRDDMPPGGAPGCTDDAASNYDPNAAQDDGSCAYPIEFAVDMNCTADPFETVFITGPFCEWCADGFELLDDDGDGVYTGTWDFPLGPLEFKFMVDNFAGQEDLIDDVAAGTGACAPVTDGATFANRQVEIMGAQSIDAAYGQCQACGEEPPPPELVDVTFSVDMNCADVDFETVYVTGPFCEWCDGGFPLVDLDGDGIWEATYAFATGPLEYKFMVDNFASQEDLLDDVQAGDGACAPITDGANFANRQAQLAAPVQIDATYGRCSACGDEPPPPAGAFETVTFDDAEIAYALAGFGGAEDSAVVVDPTDEGNLVARVTKNDMAQLWAGVTVSTQANAAVGRIPFDAENVQMTVRVWSPDAGIQVRLKVEDATDPTVSVETEATTSVANDWEVLTFNFAQQAPDTAAINFDSTYDKASIFFNFGVTGAEVGAKTYYFDDLTFIGGVGEVMPPDDMFDVTFEVDMNCTDDPFAAVFVTGPFCEWCADGFALADDDGDGIWTGTYAFAPGPLEYKYMVDNFAGQENLIDDVQAGNGACAPVTDGVNFANRQFEVAADATRAEVYGQCTACDDEPPPPADAFETVTFDDAEIAYALAGFGGAEDSAVIVDPTDAGNMVARVTKNDMAQLWAGVTVSTQANAAVGRIPFDAENVQMTVRVWSPDAGIQVRLKVEDATDPTVSVETEATTSVANDWEVLTFNFAQQAPDTAAINFDSTYDKASIFFNFGVTGAEVGAKTYYFDDLTFIGGVGEFMPPDDMFDVTFEVDMNCTDDPFAAVFVTGPFCEWCADGFALADDDGDGIWTGTYAFAPGPLEYKYMVDNFAGQENLIDDVQAGNGACAPVTDGVNFANRQFEVAADATRAEVYGQCTACDDEPPPPADAFETITFDDAEIEYALAGFGGAEDSAVIVDPTDEGNLVARVTKNDMAQLWAGVTVSTQANAAVGRIPFDAENVQMTVRVWSPDAGIQVRLKVEDATDPTVSVETEATTSVANDWEVLTFNFAQQAPDTAAINFDSTYDKASIFFNFGVTGAEVGAKTYYFDDVTFIGGAVD